MVNDIEPWNTRYIEVALNYLEGTGVPELKEDVSRLSPFIRDHLNLLGRYHFELPEEVKKGQLRPLEVDELEDFD